MFLQSLVKLHNSISVRNLPPDSGEDQKKSFLLHSGCISVWNFEFLVANWVLLTKNGEGHTYFTPFHVRLEGVPPPCPPRIDAFGYRYL